MFGSRWGRKIVHCDKGQIAQKSRKLEVIVYEAGAPRPTGHTYEHAYTYNLGLIVVLAL